MTRQEANRQIVAKLGWLVEKYPKWRFQQILQNSGVVFSGGDQWYEESDHTLKTVETMTKGW
jgi:hypothetical protein